MFKYIWQTLEQQIHHTHFATDGKQVCYNAQPTHLLLYQTSFVSGESITTIHHGIQHQIQYPLEATYNHYSYTGEQGPLIQSRRPNHCHRTLRNETPTAPDNSYKVTFTEQPPPSGPVDAMAPPPPRTISSARSICPRSSSLDLDLHKIR